jgi:hypothetical protein
MSKPTVEPLRLRKKRRAGRKEFEERRATLLRQAREFRAIGNLLSRSGETFRQRLNGAIATGLAEVCEMLAQAVEEMEEDKRQ